VDWSVRQDSQFEEDALWDTQAVKADERGSNIIIIIIIFISSDLRILKTSHAAAF